MAYKIPIQINGLAGITLPIPREIDRRLGPHSERADSMKLLAGRKAAVILAPRGFLSEAQQVRPGNVVMVSGFCPAQAREIGLGYVRASAVAAIGFLMIDAEHLIA